MAKAMQGIETGFQKTAYNIWDYLKVTKILELWLPKQTLEKI